MCKMVAMATTLTRNVSTTVLIDLDSVVAPVRPTGPRTDGWSYRRIEVTDPASADKVVVRWVADEVGQFVSRVAASGEVEVSWVLFEDQDDELVVAAAAAAGLPALPRSGPDGFRSFDVMLGERQHDPKDRLLGLESVCVTASSTADRVVVVSPAFTWSLIEDLESRLGVITMPTHPQTGLCRSDLRDVADVLRMRFVESIDQVCPRVSSVAEMSEARWGPIVPASASELVGWGR